ncbi:MAG: TlpA disulfide reductase family protein [Alphaproteobacteria bacterium]
MMRRRQVLAGVAGVAAGGLLPVAWPAPARAAALPRLDSETSQFRALQPLAAAPDVVLTDRRGVTQRLADWRGQAVVLAFWATWCPPCVREVPSLARLARRAGTLGARIAAVSMDEDGEAAVGPFLAANGVAGDLPVFLDPAERVGSFAVQTGPAESGADAPLPLYGMPITYFIDLAGRLRGYVTGAVNWDHQAAERFVRALAGLAADAAT